MATPSPIRTSLFLPRSARYSVEGDPVWAAALAARPEKPPSRILRSSARDRASGRRAGGTKMAQAFVKRLEGR